MGNRDRSWPAPPEPLPGRIVDNHTHLDFVDDILEPGVPVPTIAEHLEAAASVGVDRIVQIGCDLPAARTTVKWCGQYPILGGIAIHPNEAVLHAGVREVGPDGLEPRPQAHHRIALRDAIAEIADLARGCDAIRVIGETGLDRFRTGELGLTSQIESFREHIALAKELGLPIQIHDRDAHADVVEVLRKDGAPDRTVFHCFSGDRSFAEYCVQQGWYLSFAGPVTYKANDALREALRVTPAAQLLVETDAPFLTPHPLRGRPNAPYLAAVTARAMAEIRGQDLAAFCDVISANSEELYGPWPGL
ncbi:TatD family hydrolase [Rarobacter faecitabidus]|uniref:TatD DNase family protein n=1 Tax=Rarobacter faecitabidus TaxID=13243 RepID=A0A542ZTZ7_RARFA|nr:TatD family hydrolase [Rarobacter faecitabidus]TQL63797.1 TatD DNase family protein [Rarobacter faecitabidus]